MVRNIIEFDVKKNLANSIKYGISNFEKYLIGQFQGYDNSQNVELSKF